MPLYSLARRLLRSASTEEVLSHLPARIILIRHARSQDLDSVQADGIPNHAIPLHQDGELEALNAGKQLAQQLGDSNPNWRVHLFCSPYMRARQTASLMFSGLPLSRVAGYQEEVLLREQDYGNFVTSAAQLQATKDERMRFGRFWYRFPSGESGADVLCRMTMLQDHLVRDMVAGRFEGRDSLVLITHGLTLRVFLMRWLHWTVNDFLGVFNPPGAQPIILERAPLNVAEQRDAAEYGPAQFVPTATKALYSLTSPSKVLLPGVTDMMTRTQSSWALHKSGLPTPNYHKLQTTWQLEPAWRPGQVLPAGTGYEGVRPAGSGPVAESSAFEAVSVPEPGDGAESSSREGTGAGAGSWYGTGAHGHGAKEAVIGGGGGKKGQGLHVPALGKHPPSRR